MASSTSGYSEEDLMKQRLLFDGDGLGDERRLNLLIKNISKFCQTNGTLTDESRVLDKIGIMLDQIVCMDKRHKQIQKMNKSELNRYDDLFSTIESGIEEAKKEIAEAKTDLKVARKSRRNKMEYDALAKVSYIIHFISLYFLIVANDTQIRVFLLLISSTQFISKPFPT